MKVYKIYRIQNKITGKYYIGQTVSTLKQRWAGHRSVSGCRVLSRNISKHGEENFEMVWICSTLDKEYIDSLENYFMTKYNSIDQSQIKKYHFEGYTQETCENHRRYVYSRR